MRKRRSPRGPSGIPARFDRSGTFRVRKTGRLEWIERLTKRALSLVSMTLAIGCANGTAENGGGSEVPIFEGHVDLEVGEVDGDDQLVFGSIGGVVEDPDGRIYIADFQAHDVRVFDQSGDFLFRFGGAGGGPGELRGPCCLAWGPDGLLWVRETEGARYSAFSVSTGEAVFESRIRSQHGGSRVLAPIRFDRQGRVVDVGLRSEPDGRLDMVTVHLARTADGDSAWVLEAPPGEEVGLHTVTRGQSTLFLWQPFGPSHLVAHGPGGLWAQAVSSVYEIELHDRTGEIVEIKGPSTPGPELTVVERAQAEERVAADAERAGIGRRDMPFDVPDRKPPLRHLAFDQDGRLWVELSVDGNRRVADVYDESGAPSASYNWPSDVRVEARGWIGRDRLFGVRRDSLGVQRVARVRFSVRN